MAVSDDFTRLDEEVRAAPADRIRVDVMDDWFAGVARP